MFDWLTGGNASHDTSSILGNTQGIWGDVLPSLAGLFGNVQSMGINNNVNQGVQQGLNQNSQAVQQQIDQLNQQIATNRQQAQDMYQRSLQDVTGQNQGLQGNIDTMTSNLNALNDPNSPYMQMARQAIERKDAAAGRRSQWGEREVQLAGTLADYVGKYAPNIQSSITSARDQINRNNQGLANLYSTANNPSDRNTLALMSALQQQLAGVKEQNTTGRQSQNAQANSLQGLLSNGIKLGGSLLGGLFGGGSGYDGGMTNYYGNQAGVDNGITGYGSGIGNWYGNAGLNDMFPSTSYGNGIGSIYDNMQYGYGALPAGDYFGGGGFGGAPTLGNTGLFSNDIWD